MTSDPKVLEGTSTPRIRRLEWEDYSRAYQTLPVSITSYDLKIAPTLATPRWGKWALNFQGRSAHARIKGLLVTGSVEVLDPGEKLGVFFDHWKNPPREFEGYGFLARERGEAGSPQSFAFTLYCRPEAAEALHRTFLFGLASLHSELELEVVISYPDPVELDFWRERWRRERWAVSSWQLALRAQRFVL
jgi:hypothetical protein